MCTSLKTALHCHSVVFLFCGYSGAFCVNILLSGNGVDGERRPLDAWGKMPQGASYPQVFERAAFCPIMESAG